MLHKNIFLSLSFLFLSASASEQPSNPKERQPFEWADLANSTALNRNLRNYAALPAAVVSGFHYIAHADYIGNGKRCLKVGFLTGGLLASGIIFFSPEFKAIRAEKKHQKICKEIGNFRLAPTDSEQMETRLRMHSEAIHSLKETLERVKKQRYERNHLTGNLIVTPRNQKFYTRCEQLHKELEAVDDEIKRVI